MHGLCVGRPGLKSSCKENSWGRGEPVAQEPALGPTAALQHTDGGCAAVTPPPSSPPTGASNQQLLSQQHQGSLGTDPGGGRAHPLPLAPLLDALNSLQLQGICKQATEAQYARRL